MNGLARLAKHAGFVVNIGGATCADVLELINREYEGKKILLLSQGSVLRAMQILLRKRKHPWDDFTVSGMYHVGDDTNKKKDYGLINKVY